MAYQTGTWTDTVDGLKKVVTFLTSNGWTQDMSQADGTGWRAHLHRGSDYINLRALFNESISTANVGNASTAGADYNIAIYMGNAHNAGSAWYAQGGGPKQNSGGLPYVSYCKLPSGAVTAYHFFCDGDNFMAVIERTSGLFTHFGWGKSINKGGAVTGGQYFFGGAPKQILATGPGLSTSALAPFSQATTGDGGVGFLRVDVDAFTSKWISFNNSTNNNEGYTGKIGACSLGYATLPADIPNYNTFGLRQTSNAASQASLLPIRLNAPRDAGGYSFIGSLPMVYATDATLKGFATGSDYSYGSDTYKLFPSTSSSFPGYGVKK